MDGSNGPKQRVKYVDLILFVFGLKLYASPGIQNFFNVGLRVACAAIFYLNLITFIVIGDHKDDVFLSLAFIFKYLIFILLHHYCCLKMSDLRSLFDDHDKIVQSFEQGTFEQHRLGSKGFLKAWAVVTLTALVATGRVVSYDYKGYANKTTKYEKRSHKENIVNAILTTVFMNLLLVVYNCGWIYATFVFYAYVYHLFRELNENFAREALRPFSELDEGDGAKDEAIAPSSSPSELLAQLRDKRASMQELKHRANLYLGLLPLLWYLLVYFETSWLVIATSFSSLVANLGEVIYRCTISVYVVAITFFAEHVYGLELRATDTLLGKLKAEAADDADLLNEKLLFVKEITESPVISPKIMLFIPLNKFALMVLFGVTLPSALAIRLFT